MIRQALANLHKVFLSDLRCTPFYCIAICKNPFFLIQLDVNVNEP